MTIQDESIKSAISQALNAVAEEFQISQDDLYIQVNEVMFEDMDQAMTPLREKH